MRAVAILKSGVVDGMGYTLYVDGSIEAELPQGTLRFASINELRSHLEKTFLSGCAARIARAARGVARAAFSLVKSSLVFNNITEFVLV